MDNLSSIAWLMTLSSGLMAGIYLTFSVVVMRSLATLEPQAGAAAMNAINRSIVHTAFMPLFFGSTIIALLQLSIGVVFWGDDRALFSVLAAIIYVLGMFVVTVAENVPLNNELDRASFDTGEVKLVWDKYLVHWTRWNTVRAIACLATLVLSIDVVRG